MLLLVVVVVVGITVHVAVAVCCCVTRKKQPVTRYQRSSTIPTTTAISTAATAAAQACCWTYSHHCQIPDKNSWKRWNGEFRGFVYVLDGFPQRDFVLWVFMCPTNIIIFCVYFVFLFCVSSSLFSVYHAAGCHAPSIPHGLSRLYHQCTATTLVSFPATTP